MKKSLIILGILGLIGSNFVLAHDRFDNRPMPDRGYNRPPRHHQVPKCHKHNKIKTSFFYSNRNCYSCCQRGYYTPFGGINLHISL